MRFNIWILLPPVLLLVGHFLPWAAHETAALTQSAHDLAISTAYTPGAGIFLHTWFYLPLWVAALILALLVQPSAPLRLRVIVAAIGTGVASLGLPVYPNYLLPEMRLQLALSGVTILGVLACALAPAMIPAHWRPWLRTGLLLVAMVPVAGFFFVRPAIQALYGDQVDLGFGLTLTAAGAIGELAASIRDIRDDLRSRRA